MRVLLDTHLLLWLSHEPELLSRRARRFLMSDDQSYLFSVASVWETSIKQALGRPGFQVDVAGTREGLLAGGMEELPILASHALAVAHLPLLHHDPFDRLLVAQTLVEGLVLATVDKTLTRYSPQVKYVG